MRTLLLIDGDPIMFRAYFGGGAEQSFTKDGLPVGAVTGFINRLTDLIYDDLKDHRFSHIAVVFDSPGPGWRNKIDPLYKANRPARDIDLVVQLALVKRIIPWMGLRMVEQRGFEADDLIATYEHANYLDCGETVIASSDKDLSCLVRPGTVLYSPMSREWIDEAWVLKKFGVPPALVPEVQALCGDTVDNIPGIPKCGPVTAGRLVAEHLDIEGVIAACEAGEATTVKPSVCASIVEMKDDLRRWRKLVALNRNVPIARPLHEFAVGQPDGKTLIAGLKALEMGKMTTWFSWKLGIDQRWVQPLPAMLEMAEEMMEWRNG